MSTTYYAPYVLINVNTGTVVWYENHATALKNQKTLGGVIYNTSTTDPATLNRALHRARQRMGVE